MKKIVEFFVNRPMLVNLFIISVFGFAFLSLSKMRKEAFPEVAMGRFIITTIYPGASAADVEINVTLPIEDAIEELEGIQEVKSYSREGYSLVDITADENLEEKELQRLYMDVDSAISNINNLPTGLKGKPVIDEISSGDLPVLEIAFSGTYEQIKDFIPTVKEEIQKINGVSAVKTIGLGDEEVHILMDPELAKKEFVDLLTVAAAIKKRNLHGSGGTLKSFLDEKKIVSYEKFRKPEEILDTYIRMSPDGFGVKLGKIAKLEYQPEDLKLIVRNNGKRGVSLLIQKKKKADILKTIDGVSNYLDTLKLPEGVTFKKLNDGSRLTRTRISLVLGNAMMGFGLVLLLLFLVFDMKTAFWTAFGIPFSLLGCLVVLQLMGMSLNVLALGGFIIVVGMLVDDAIVISETINSNKEKGMNPVEAASAAVEEVWAPVLASSATTTIAFLPLISLGGLPGKFIWVIPLVVILSLAISLFESYFMLPTHMAHGKAYIPQKKQFIVKLENSYRSILIKVLHHRVLFILSIILLLGITIITFKKFMKKDPFPQDASEGFIINLLLPKGASVQKTESLVERVEAILHKLPEKDVEGFSARIGTNSESTTTERGSVGNSAVIFTYLTPFGKRKTTASELEEMVRVEIEKEIKKELVSYSSKIIRFGPPMGRPFEIRLISNDNELRKEKSIPLKKFLSEIPGVFDVNDDEIEGKDELNLKINHEILARAGLSVDDVLTTLHIAFEGKVVTDLVNMDKKLDFRLRLNEKARADVRFIRSLPILNRAGQEINFKEFISIEEKNSSDEIRHINGKRYLAVFGNLNKDIISPQGVVDQVKANFSNESSLQYEFAGEPVENAKIFKNLGIAAIFALAGIYLIIALIFNSYLKPFIVILAIPFGIIGVILSVFAHGMALSLFVGVALVGLMGVIVNNSIVMVFTTSEIAGEGKITKEIIVDGAVQRLRPIILTTTTTILGLLPTAYGIGGYDPFLSPMSLALSYGLLFGTVVVLYFIPTVYSIGIDLGEKFSRQKSSELK
ncbi:MAG: efflux RND transporter permease subunit [Leptospiraceae bacterium]|nr:efflux RND transporter permease subunit [Leptospiraceae bacterium]